VDTQAGVSTATQYAYDAKGMRIIKDGPYGKSIYVDTGYVLSQEYVESNHVFVGNTRVASVVKHREETKPAMYYYASDHLGSSSVLTTSTGSYHERIEYLPYGEVWVEDAVNSNGYTTPYKFTGKELDKETGLYYFGARYYDARISRWISTDPALQEGKYFPKPNDYDTEHDFYWYLQQDGSKKLAGLGGVFNAVNMDVYHYAGNNPVKLVDPDGEDVILLNDSSGAFGFGHNAILIGNEKDGWVYFSKDGESFGLFGFDKTTIKMYKSIKEFFGDKTVSERYNRAYHVKTKKNQDIAMGITALSEIQKEYNIEEVVDSKTNETVEGNCADLIANVINSGNKSKGSKLKIEKPKTVYKGYKFTSPNVQFNKFVKQNKGKFLKNEEK